MFTDHYWARCVLVSAVFLFPTSSGSAQDDPFGGLDPGGAEGAIDPAAVPGAAPAKEQSVLGVELADAMQPIDQDFCRCVGESNSAAVAGIEKALNSPLKSNGLDFTETPLEEVVNLLQDEYGIPIQIDETALEAAGLGSTEKVTVNLHNISLASALRLMLKKLHLTYIIGDEVLLITTPEEADAHVVTCVYNVRGIVADTSYNSMEELINVIVSCVSTDTWAENGGGEAEIRPLKSGLLVISQTRDVHEQISGLLKAIREMRGGEGGVGGLGADEVVTRLYVLQVKENAEKLGEQVRDMIIQSIPDAQWDGRLPDGQSVTLTVLADRIIVRQTPAIQERVEELLKESGVAAPARPGEINRGRRGSEMGGRAGRPENGGEVGFFAPQVHEARISE